jgi:hypothetical protein
MLQHEKRGDQPGRRGSLQGETGAENAETSRTGQNLHTASTTKVRNHALK